MNDITENTLIAVPQNSQPTTAPVAVSPMELIQMAVQSDAPIDKLEKLMDLQERYEANEARKAFNVAMSHFRTETVDIRKTRKASFDHRDGQGKTEYSFADLGDIVEAAVPALGKHGLSHHWDTEQRDGLITVTCVLTHELGHEQRTTLMASPDSSGKKNGIQAIGSAMAYLQRYTFLAATGLAARGVDDDGHSAAPSVANTLIDEVQVGQLTKLLKETGADKDAFLGWLGFPSLEDITQGRFEEAYLKLQKKKAQQKTAADGGDNS